MGREPNLAHGMAPGPTRFCVCLRNPCGCRRQAAGGRDQVTSAKYQGLQSGLRGESESESKKD